MGKSWMTTVAGLVGAIANVLVDLLQHGTVDTKTITTSIAIAILGVLSKDFNVSGTPTAKP